MIILKSPEELECMRKAARIVAETHQYLKGFIAPGITTGELDRLAEDFICKKGAKPAFKGLYGFPNSICTSLNEEVVHGIPGLRKLENGDIISIDIGSFIDGFCGDGAATYPVGSVCEDAQRLLKVTEEALLHGIELAVEGNRLSDVSHAIQSYVEANGFSVVRDYVGHGIGRSMHEDPQVPNFGKPGRGPRLRPGMTFAIEPMVNIGTYQVVTKSDRWTVVTKDGEWSAHFEHSIAITESGPEILTKL